MFVGTPALPVLMIIGSCTSLQFGAALAAHLFPITGAAGATFFRLLLAGAFLLAVTRPRVRRWDRTQWRAVLVFGLTLATMNGCFYAALSRIPLGTAVTIEFVGPLTLAAVLSRRARDLVWVGLAATGVLLLAVDAGGLAGGASADGVVTGTAGDGVGAAASGLDPVGVALALVAGACWAFYILASSRVGSAVPGQGGLAVATAAASLMLLPIGLHGAVAVVGRPEALLLAAGVALLASVIPYSLEFMALRRMPTAVFGVLLSLEPAIATVAGWLLLGQTIGALGGLAVGVVIAASAGSTLTARRPS